MVSASDALEIAGTIRQFGPIPPLEGITAESIVGRLKSDKKTVKGKVHFVLPERIGKVRIVSDVEEGLVFSAVRAALK
jgi:3-dehydroquinate synthase